MPGQEYRMLELSLFTPTSSLAQDVEIHFTRSKTYVKTVSDLRPFTGPAYFFYSFKDPSILSLLRDREGDYTLIDARSKLFIEERRGEILSFTA